MPNPDKSSSVKLEECTSTKPNPKLRSADPRYETAGDDAEVQIPEKTIGLTPPKRGVTPIDKLTDAIEANTERLSFSNYKTFIDPIMCKRLPAQFEGGSALDAVDKLRKLPFPDTERYRMLKVATEAFMAVNAGVQPGEDFQEENSNPYLVPVDKGSSIKILPYLAIIRRKFPELNIKLDTTEDANCFGLLQEKLEHPFMIELIWSYWHEEAMLVQTVNAISMRFQNRRLSTGRDPLSQLETNPLRSLSNILWGYIQDEQHRLTVARRAYEYLHHYGITLQGTAVPKLDYAESRSKFIEAFHTLLNIASKFFLQSDDMTVRADGFPVLNALKEVHLLLSQGAHNQFGDLPWTARQEMLMQQWILAQPEFKEFLPRRIMVAYPEPWMDSVDSMRRLQGWGQTVVLHYNNLAVFGEQILLSIRWGDWTEIHSADSGANWAINNRSKIQSYIHDYRAVTGVDLAANRTVADRVDTEMPSAHLVKRLAAEQQAMRA